ncbi:MAG TPA: hypothetical protein VEY95_12020 [Azospirillaceae bacterium]|nr:hypothetical protein [Azospirillaceae bacterium]
MSQSFAHRIIVWNWQERRFQDVGTMAEFEAVLRNRYIRSTLKLVDDLTTGSDHVFLVVSSVVKELPVHGPNVVVFLLDDEQFEVPRYAHRVGAIFKCFGEKPYLDRRLRMDGLQALILARYLRCWGRWAASSVAAWRAGDGARAPIHPIPIGYDDQVDLDPPPILTRDFDVGFEGSVGHAGTGGGLIASLGTPKQRSRAQMVEVLTGYLAQRPNVKANLVTVATFWDSRNAGPVAYSQRLAQTKICLVPRGTLSETVRYYQALRYGCIAIAERQPGHWYLSGSPAVILDDWKDLPRTLDALLGDPQTMEAMSKAALAWWRDRCAEEALATYVVECLTGFEPSRVLTMDALPPKEPVAA